MAWQTFSVSLKGEPEPVMVTTNARDWAGVTMDPNKPKALDMTFQVVHAALRRNGVSVPRDYAGFLEVLEDIPEAQGDEAPDLDPTEPAPSDGLP